MDLCHKFISNVSYCGPFQLLIMSYYDLFCNIEKWKIERMMYAWIYYLKGQRLQCNWNIVIYIDHWFCHTEIFQLTKISTRTFSYIYYCILKSNSLSVSQFERFFIKIVIVLVRPKITEFPMHFMIPKFPDDWCKILWNIHGPICIVQTKLQTKNDFNAWCSWSKSIHSLQLHQINYQLTAYVW